MSDTEQRALALRLVYDLNDRYPGIIQQAFYGVEEDWEEARHATDMLAPLDLDAILPLIEPYRRPITD